MLGKKYAALPYSREAINDIDHRNIEFTITDQLFLELILLEIRGMSIPFSAKIKREKKEKEASLNRQITLLEELITKKHSDLVSEILSETKLELEQIRKENLKGSVLRSRVNWIENGEKPSKYFCALERRNYVNKTLIEVINSKGEKIVQQDQILKEIKVFYNNLYKSKDESLSSVDLDVTLNSYNIPKLNKIEAESLEGEITYEEATET